MEGTQGTPRGDTGTPGEFEVEESPTDAGLDLEELKEVTSLRELQKETKKSASDIRDLLVKKKSHSDLPAVRLPEDEKKEPSP